MNPQIEQIIGRELKKHGEITSEKLSSLAAVTRQYAHKILLKLVLDKKLIMSGKARNTRYILYTKNLEKRIGQKETAIHSKIKNSKIQEDLIYDNYERNSQLFKALNVNTRSILRYAFTEMLNNAIDHSASPDISISIYFKSTKICFEINDFGIGIFNNLKKKYGLKDDYEAIQELLKGKKTTNSKKHSGEGIFFTSKVADEFEIESSKLKLIINNSLNDVAVEELEKLKKGTKIIFMINKNSKRNLRAIFNEYTDENYAFSRTAVTVKLYQKGTEYVSRSQARRVLFDMGKFKSIVLDFKKVKGIGQSFADEIFRVFKSEHPSIDIQIKNANEAVMFMIKRAKADK